MKLIKKVRPIDVKRAFLMTHFLNRFGVAKKNDKQTPSKEKYLRAHMRARKMLEEMSAKQIDRKMEIYGRRLKHYNAVRWYIGEIETKEVGVWKKAGGLPKSWTDGSLAYTARLVKSGLKNNSRLIKRRSKRVIPIIIEMEKLIKKDKYSLPIVFEREVGRVKRKGLKKMRFEIDDGNMRSIAYAISGDKKIKTYIGILK